MNLLAQYSRPLSPHRRSPFNRQGSMVTLVVTALIVLMVAGVIGIDVAYMHVTRAELRTATDSAARAGVEALQRTQNIDQARAAAIEYAGRNTVAGAPLQLSPEDIEIGSTTGGGNSRFNFVAGANPPTAMRINGRRTNGSLSGPIPLFFGPMFGQGTFQPVQLATAARVELDVALVLDMSGSMTSQSRWNGLLQAVQVFVNELEQTPQQERVSMTTYHSTAQKRVAMTTNLQSINNSLATLTPTGMTAIGRGMQTGLTTFSDPGARPFALRAMVVMTDGIHNTGVTPLSVVPSVTNQNVVIHTITFSSGANQNAMRQVATQGGGIHVHANNNTQLGEAFRLIARQLAVLLIE